MAKKTYSHEIDPKTKKPVVVEIPGMTKAQRKSLGEFPWTPAPKTRWEKIKRNLI